MSHDLQKAGNNTKCVHGGVDVYANKGAVSMPIYQSSTFAFDNADHGADLFAGKCKGYIYTRIGNPTIEALENAVALLEGGKFALATSTGMSAITTLYMTYLSKDSHIVTTDAIYGPSRNILARDFSRFGVQASFVDTSKLENIEKAIKPNTKLLFIETPANPTISITDLAGCRKIADKHKLIFVVDNTFASPIGQRPFDFGADIIIHSMTKFLNGHGDVVAGMLVTKEEKYYQELKKVLVYMGGTMDPHQAWLVHRGLKTLGIRIERESENGLKLARFLEAHPKVDWVLYPGLESHPQHSIYKKQMLKPGALISFGVKGGFEAGKTVMNSVKVATLAVSLGGIETLIQHPASMTHAGMSKEDREKAGITDNLIRYSAGIEEFEDLRDDLSQALSKI